MKFQISNFKFQKQPDKQGHFGIYGGRYISETLMPAVLELEKAYREFRNERDFKRELEYYLKEYVGRPTPLYFAERLTKKVGGAKIYLKREDLCHTGARQHGVATATVAAMFGLECEIYMGTEDIERQKPNVFRMKLLGAKVNPVSSGSCTLKDAMK